MVSLAISDRARAEISKRGVNVFLLGPHLPLLDKNNGLKMDCVYFNLKHIEIYFKNMVKK
jgi:hypothetical protein